MTWALDRKLHWTDHYVEYGFAVVKSVVGDEFIQPALSQVHQLVGNHLPLHQWTVENVPLRHNPNVTENQVLRQVYDQPGVRKVIDTMFGSPADWTGQRHFQLFISPFDPNAKAEVSPEGHVDFVNTPIPIFGSGFTFQVSLVKSEPFSGNITLYPGTHKLVQQALVKNPDAFYPGDLQHLLKVEPFEFVAEPGDMLLFHHLVGHGGNNNHAAGRSPRVALHCQCYRRQWLREIDPADPTLSPWARSLAFTGGKYRTRQDEEQWIKEFAKTRKSKPAAAGTKAY